jgi:hypothetical protein
VVSAIVFDMVRLKHDGAGFRTSLAFVSKRFCDVTVELVEAAARRCSFTFKPRRIDSMRLVIDRLAPCCLFIFSEGFVPAVLRYGFDPIPVHRFSDRLVSSAELFAGFPCSDFRCEIPEFVKFLISPSGARCRHLRLTAQLPLC